MQHKESLEKILEKQWGWHKSRLGFAACLLLSLVQQKTVNFVSLSLAFGSEAKATSRYRRIQRFFQGFEFSQTQVSLLILKLLPAPPYTVCLDRTNWQFGKFNINILMLSIAYQGIAFPICWQFLAKKGSGLGAVFSVEKIHSSRFLFKLSNNATLAVGVARRAFSRLPPFYSSHERDVWPFLGLGG